MSCKLFRSLELLQNNGKRNFLYVIYATSRIPRLRWGQPLLAEVGPFFGESVLPSPTPQEPAWNLKLRLWA